MAQTSFWDSNLLLIIVTALLAAVTYYIYAKQKVDRKKDAASIILLEIKRAEEKLKEAKELMLKNNVVPETIFLMKTANWDKYRHLFVRNFTTEEWNDIDEFYEKCALYDEAVKYNNTFFQKNEEQTRVNLQHALSGYVQDFLKDIARKPNESEKDGAKKVKEAYEKLNELLAGFSEEFMKHLATPGTGYFYAPRKPLTDARLIIDTIDVSLSTSTIGTKLEYIISENSRQRIFRWLVGAKA